MDTCEMCNAIADCRVSDGWLLCEECEGLRGGLEVSDAAWRLGWWIYPDSPAERVDFMMMKAQMEVQYG
jgi:hypothetical protein